jgi:hypothetical protein
MESRDMESRDMESRDMESRDMESRLPSFSHLLIVILSLFLSV